MISFVVLLYGLNSSEYTSQHIRPELCLLIISNLSSIDKTVLLRLTSFGADVTLDDLSSKLTQ